MISLTFHFVCFLQRCEMWKNSVSRGSKSTCDWYQCCFHRNQYPPSGRWKDPVPWYPRVFGGWYARPGSCAVGNQVWRWKSKVLKHSQTGRTSPPSCCKVFCTKLTVFCFGISFYLSLFIYFFSPHKGIGWLLLFLTLSQMFTPFFWPLFWITDLQMQWKLHKLITVVLIWFFKTAPSFYPVRIEVPWKISTAKYTAE